MNQSVNRGSTIQKNSNSIIHEDSVPAPELVLGKKFLNNKNEEVHLEEIQKAHLIFLFFTGLWMMCFPLGVMICVVAMLVFIIESLRLPLILWLLLLLFTLLGLLLV